MKIQHTLFSPYAVGVGARIGAQINGFALIMVASRALDLGEFGSYAIAWAVTVVFTTLIYTGVYHVLMRTKDFERDVDTFFWLQLTMGTIGSLIMTSAGLLFGDIWSNGTAFALVFMAPIPVIAVLGAWNEAQLMRQGRLRTTSMSVLASEVCGMIAALAMFYKGFGIEALVASQYASTLFAALLSTAIVRRLPRFQLRLRVAKTTLTEAWPLWGSAMLGMLSNYGADLILGAFLNSGAVGAYRAGSRVANTAADVVLQPLAAISWARFAKLEVQSAQGEIRIAWIQNMALGFVLIAPVMVSISLLAEPIVEALFDTSWGAVATIVSILALGRATDSMTFLLEPTMTCLGKPKSQFYLRLAGAVLVVMALITFGRSSGQAAATVVFLSNLAVAIVAVALMMSATGLKLRELFGALLPGTCLTAICVLLIYLLGPGRTMMNPLAGLVMTVGALAVTWLTTVMFLLRNKIITLPSP
jgi:O-antigen/teichoic acid export membrane protein